MIVVFITCKDTMQAKKIGLALVKKRLAGCSVVIPGATSFFWPSGKHNIAENRETILLVKTLARKFRSLEQEVKRLHSYEVPCILAIPVMTAHRAYLDWLTSEVR